MRFERTNAISVNIYGTDYVIKKPTYKQVSLMQEMLEAQGEKAGLKVAKEFLIALGLNADVIDEMEIEHINELVLGLITKKN